MSLNAAWRVLRDYQPPPWPSDWRCWPRPQLFPSSRRWYPSIMLKSEMKLKFFFYRGVVGLLTVVLLVSSTSSLLVATTTLVSSIASTSTVVISAISTATTTSSIAETFLNCCNSALNIFIRSTNVSSTISFLWKKKMSRHCSKCLENISTHNLRRRLLLKLRCGHYIHFAVVELWLRVGQ